MTKEAVQSNNDNETKIEARGKQAPAGTYEFLKGILEEGSDIRLFNTIRHKTWVRVFSETECAETGGSCMDLLIRNRTGVGEITWSHAHITNEDKIARLKSDVEGKEGNRRELPAPNLSDMLQTLSKMLPQK